MTPPIAFDPGAELLPGPYGVSFDRQLVEATLDRQADNKLELVLQDSDGLEILTVVVRPDFLDALIAHARTREENAA